MLTSFYKRVVLIPFGILLIAITICWVFDKVFIVHQFPVKISPYPIFYIFDIVNLIMMTVGCLTIFLNNYPAIRNNVMLSALAWFSGYLSSMTALLIIGKVDLSAKIELNPGLILLAMFILVPLITTLIEFIKYRRVLTKETLQ